MNPDTRWKVFAGLGTGAFTFALYAIWKTLLYFKTSSDTTGAAIFGCVAVCLLLVAGLHWYMAVGFKVGQLDLATGSMAAATLQKGNRVVIDSQKVQFVRRLDTDDSSLAANDRYVFFICANRPWVCKESQFQVA
ncbi:hypothetical protein [Paucibacter sp. KBW04]|uniref:hypothetical protein n=1 Tax=Paucibacter sp. KBW04 TaxID=2153361 RepID=UPI000F5636EB|nr:hypothetical protein [Paucibacter sp. KBW04]